MTARVRPMTGYHMAGILVGFFAIVIVVNFYMAYLAVSTFTGTVVDNSYVASQQFNGWLAEARTEKALGWQATVALDAERHVTVRVIDKSGRPLAPLDASGSAGRAMMNEKATKLRFVPFTAGAVRAVDPIPTGRWVIKLDLVSGTQHFRVKQDVR